MEKKKVNLTEENKKAMILVVAILVVMLVCYLIISFITNSLFSFLLPLVAINLEV